MPAQVDPLAINAQLLRPFDLQWKIVNVEPGILHC